ncbi:respiratory chain complex I subunit 1 family protein [Anaerocolumna xylanovorans]|uniref:Ech hydrogenase subunit B n=1 Tax=Anaerocolumna xylanovorans DSM 12503 TaxID=1121345 RepID=A0A1M7YL09_9FIRM|nr:complex I subunit 1 family protein [Anaerocolumna xylanovorans]SHO53299.1 ech hydrogenase subunit B [Anaerocolumna xylanovorans DSM 12503]
MLIIKILAIIILTPIVGGLLTGIDRVITARMQGRQGPPILQPFYDVFKLIQKEPIEVNLMHRFYVYLSLIFVILTAVILLVGGDILLAVFALTLGSVLFILGGYASNSPYSLVGSERELLQMMAYEPMVLLTGIGFYLADKSFFVSDIVKNDIPAIVYLPGMFLGFVFILTFKLRKSPFDFSMSHHGHQEIVQGITTEYSGKDLAVIEVTHWYEEIIAFTFIFLFFATKNPISILVGIIACFLVYFLEILIDNGFARMKWNFALKSAWIVTAVLGSLNLIILSYFK